MTTLERPFVVMPVEQAQGPEQGKWTYQDYATLPEDGHVYEVVDGVLYMSPSPSWNHQSIVGRIYHYLFSAIELTGIGKVCIAPLDVELSYRTVVQPDVFVLINQHHERITGSRVIGAPDLVVEVASPGTARHDLNEKLSAYANAGVPEYWIVNPDARTVELLILEQKIYRSHDLFFGRDSIPSRIASDLPVPVEQFFAGMEHS